MGPFLPGGGPGPNRYPPRNWHVWPLVTEVLQT